MARATRHKAAKDYPEQGIKKSDMYYKWKFNFNPTVHRSLTPPKRSQLTQSGFLSQLYDLEDTIIPETIDGCKTTDDITTAIEEITEQIDQLRDECQESLDNMPEHLQESSGSGLTLTERIESLEQWSDEFQDILVDDDDVTSLQDTMREIVPAI